MKQATLQGNAPTLDVALVLQLLEAQRLSGTFRLGTLWLRLRAGLVVKASGDAVEVVRELLTAQGEFSFRAVCGTPQGPLSVPVTALLLEAARVADEAAL